MANRLPKKRTKGQIKVGDRRGIIWNKLEENISIPEKPEYRIFIIDHKMIILIKLLKKNKDVRQLTVKERTQNIYVPEKEEIGKIY